MVWQPASEALATSCAGTTAGIAFFCDLTTASAVEQKLLVPVLLMVMALPPIT
jgi:hypothetical protein